MVDWMIRVEPRQQPADDHDWRLVAFDRAQPDRALGQVLLRRHAGAQTLRHWYHRGLLVNAAPELGIHQRQQTLLLGNDLTDASELSALRCDDADEARAPAVLAALVQASVCWLAREHAPAPGVAPRLFAELPGLRDAQGHSPFWQGLGQHFVSFTPGQAERRFGPQWLRDLAPLMPRHPLLVALLAEPAQAALSRAAPEAALLAQALRDEGFADGEHVTVFDGGPVYEAPLSTLRTARAAGWRNLRSAPAEIPPAWPEGPVPRCWLSRGGELRLHAAQFSATDLWLARRDMDTNGWTEGDRLWCAPAWGRQE